MKHVHMFQWNIPSENHFANRTDRFLNIIAEWDGDSFFDDGRPMVFVNLINPDIHDCISVLDWFEAKRQIEKAALTHFADIARQEKIARAKAELIAEGELEENPILQRLQNY